MGLLAIHFFAKIVKFKLLLFPILSLNQISMKCHIFEKYILFCMVIIYSAYPVLQLTQYLKNYTLTTSLFCYIVSLSARLFGLVGIIYTDCSAPLVLHVRPYLDWPQCASPGVILVLYWLLATETRFYFINVGILCMTSFCVSVLFRV